MKIRLAIAALITATLLATPIQANSSGLGSLVPKNAVLSSMDVSISYPNEVRLTRKNCGEFAIKYSVRRDPARAYIFLTDLDGRELGGVLINRFSEFRREWDDPKGTFYFEYCKKRWTDDYGDTWPGFTGGWVNVELVISSSGGRNHSTYGRFFVKK